MGKLSKGNDGTLGTYLKECITVFGEDSEPCSFLRGLIARDPKGSKHVVCLSEDEMVLVLGGIFTDQLRSSLQ